MKECDRCGEMVEDTVYCEDCAAIVLQAAIDDMMIEQAREEE